MMMQRDSRCSGLKSRVETEKDRDECELTSSTNGVLYQSMPLGLSLIGLADPSVRIMYAPLFRVLYEKRPNRAPSVVASPPQPK